jgi:hypothetical protein
MREMDEWAEAWEGRYREVGAKHSSDQVAAPSVPVRVDDPLQMFSEQPIKRYPEISEYSSLDFSHEKFRHRELKMPEEIKEESYAILEKADRRARGEAITGPFMKSLRAYRRVPTMNEFYSFVEQLNKQKPFKEPRPKPVIPYYNPEEYPHESMETTLQKYQEICKKLYGKATTDDHMQFIVDQKISQETLQRDIRFYTEHPEELEE